jgi:hypothetical protein
MTIPLLNQPSRRLIEERECALLALGAYEASHARCPICAAVPAMPCLGGGVHLARAELRLAELEVDHD